MVNKQYSNNDLETFMKLAANWQNSHNHNLLEGVDIKGEMQHYLNNTAMNNMYKKRERTQNWNHQEKKFLLDLCRKDMRIIENKRLDAGLTAVKNKAWKIIHQKFSTQFGTDRTCNRLKEQWRRMKACTRNEILDYNNRITRFGPEVADRKKPSPFTFEVWEFMQEAKKACKSETLDGIDYSKIPLALEEDYEYREDDHNNDEDHDIDDSRTPPQELCDVDIKDEMNENVNDICHEVGTNSDRLLASTPSSNRLSNDLDGIGMHSPADYSTCGDPSPLNSNNNNNNNSNNFMAPAPNDMSNAFQAGFNMNNISATLEALNALRAGQFPTAAAAAAALQNNFAAAAHQHQHQQHQQQHQQHQHQQHQQQQQHSLPLQTASQNDETILPAKRPRTSSCSNLIGPSTSLATITASNDDHPISSDVTTNLTNYTSPHPSNTSHTSSNNSLNNNNDTNVNNVVSNSIVANTTTNCLTTSDELRAFMDMQNKEHIMRMRILEVQLQTAKYNRDLVEINKTLAIQKLQEYASKRLAS